MTAALYIFLGVLVVGVVAMQVWMARSQARLAGERAGLVRTIRIANIALLVIVFGIVAYAILTR